MELTVSGITVPLEHTEKEVFDRAVKISGVSKNNIKSLYIHKKSVDARKGGISLVYSVGICLHEREKIKNDSRISEKKLFEYKLKERKSPPSWRPVIVGAGPAGLFCCYLLCLGGFKPVVIERGKKTEERAADVERFFSERLLDTESNIQFGEGGAGTFSDGKLVTRINDIRCDFIMKTLAENGAPEEIKYLAKPHVGTDMLRQVTVNMRNRLENMGAEFRFGVKMNEILTEGGKIKGVSLSDGNKLASPVVVLATGHSARDTYEMLYGKGIIMEKKPFSVGVRIEHKREFIDAGRYGKYAGHPRLKAAEYQFSYRKGNRGCYTFCMCPGGSVVAAASEENTVVTNGMSDFARNGENSNSAVAVSVLPEDTGTNFLGGIEFQRRLEKIAFEAGGGSYAAPVQLSSDFVSGVKTTSLKSVKPTYPCGYEFAELGKILPGFVTELLKEGLTEFDKKIKGFALGEGVLTGIETRTSAPLRILRGEDFSSLSVKGLFPCGEGAGYAGGITSAAADGLRIAEYIIENYEE